MPSVLGRVASFGSLSYERCRRLMRAEGGAKLCASRPRAIMRSQHSDLGYCLNLVGDADQAAQ